MKTYGELNLKELREKADLDFAHYTYLKGMCSCCYGPKDLPKMYWRDRKIPESSCYSDHDLNGYTYLLFKNAYNGSGAVKRSDLISGHTYIEWSFPIEKLDMVCHLLKDQLDDDYCILVPKTSLSCIIILEKEDIQHKKYDEERYTILE